MVRDDIYYFLDGVEDKLYEELMDEIDRVVDDAPIQSILSNLVDEIIEGEITLVKPIMENVSYDAIISKARTKIDSVAGEFKEFIDTLINLYDSVADTALEDAKERGEDEPTPDDYNFLADMFISDIEENYSNFVEYFEGSRNWNWDSELELKKKARNWREEFDKGISSILEFFANIPDILSKNSHLIISAVFEPLKHYPEDVVI
jgi:hypothetical protein